MSGRMWSPTMKTKGSYQCADMIVCFQKKIEAACAVCISTLQFTFLPLTWCVSFLKTKYFQCCF